MEFKKFTQTINQHQTDPVYVFLGSEQYLQDQARQKLLGLFTEDELEMNVATYDMSETPLAVAMNDASSMPFFGEQRLVMIQNPYFLTGEIVKNKLDHDLDELLHYLEHPLESTILAFFAPYEKLDERKKVTKQLKKQAVIVDCGKMNARDVQRTVEQVLKQQKASIEPDALRRLLELKEDNFSQVMLELPKLILYAGVGNAIVWDAVEQLVPKSLEQNVFELVELVLSQKVEGALRLYQDLLLQQEEPIKLNALLISQFRLFIQVKLLQEQGYDQGMIAKTIKVHPYRVKLAMQKSRQFSLSSLTQAYDGLVEAEYQMKTGQMDKQLLFELFVLKFSQNQ